jgi:hypothetical protein
MNLGLFVLPILFVSVLLGLVLGWPCACAGHETGFVNLDLRIMMLVALHIWTRQAHGKAPGSLQSNT